MRTRAFLFASVLATVILFGLQKHAVAQVHWDLDVAVADLIDPCDGEVIGGGIRGYGGNGINPGGDTNEAVAEAINDCLQKFAKWGGVEEYERIYPNRFVDTYIEAEYYVTIFRDGSAVCDLISIDIRYIGR